MKNRDWEYLHTVVKVAHLYYTEGKTQEEIAKQLGISRPTISRMLDYAKRSGIVSIRLNVPNEIFPELEDRLEKMFSLEEVVIVASNENTALLKQNLGRGGADLLKRKIKGIKSLGISWGSTLYEVVNNFPTDLICPEIRIVQLVGGVNPLNSSVYADELAKSLALKLGGNAYILRAPMVVDSPEIRDMLLKESHIKEVLSLACKVNVAIVGIGAMDSNSILLTSGCVSERELEEIREKGGVGDILGRFYDLNGKPISSSLENRIIGIGIEELMKIPYIIGVAGGRNKLKAILGALRMGVLNGLVTDEQTTRELLSLGG
ncbi:MAG: sugar-binding transcriptional regulator [bacterium]|nr:sugar-binding transcriptional regulator [bacterium]